MDDRQKHCFLKAAAFCPLPELRKRGLCVGDFMSSQSEETDPYRIASAAVRYFCSDGSGRFNGLIPAILIALRFLEDLTSVPCQDVQLMTDLKRHLEAGHFDLLEKYFRDFFRN